MPRSGVAVWWSALLLGMGAVAVRSDSGALCAWLWGRAVCGSLAVLGAASCAVLRDPRATAPLGPTWVLVLPACRGPKWCGQCLSGAGAGSCWGLFCGWWGRGFGVGGRCVRWRVRLGPCLTLGRVRSCCGSGGHRSSTAASSEEGSGRGSSGVLCAVGRSRTQWRWWRGTSRASGGGTMRRPCGRGALGTA